MNDIIPSKDMREIFMRAVYDWSTQSKDPRSHIGAVLVKNEVQISSGYNNFPRKVLDLVERYHNRETKLKFVIHAEENAILNAAREGTITLGSVLYTQGIPCINCMKSIVNAGVVKIVVHKQWEDAKNPTSEWAIMNEVANIMRVEGGVELEYYDKVLGITTLWGGKEIAV
jgi:dCMP deaminase